MLRLHNHESHKLYSGLYKVSEITRFSRRRTVSSLAAMLTKRNRQRDSLTIEQVQQK